MNKIHYNKTVKLSHSKSAKRIGFIISFYFITMVFAYIISLSVKADSEPKPVYIDSRVVKPGETLWSIANSYNSSYYKTTYEYVEAIKECNNLSGDEVFSGTNLIIPYTE